MSIENEKKVLKHLIFLMEQKGWKIYAVDDGGEFIKEGDFVEAATAVEMASLFFIDRNETKKSVCYISGNDWDCIADHDLGDGFEEAMNQFYEELEKMQETPKRETNIQALTRIMEFARSGPLMQVFILDQLGKSCDYLIKNEEKVRVALEGSMVHPDSWMACAKELKQELDKHLNHPSV